MEETEHTRQDLPQDPPQASTGTPPGPVDEPGPAPREALPAPSPAPGEIDVAALQASKMRTEQKVDTERKVPVWEREDAPPGSTASSLLVYERGEPVRVHGPTHYHHLADGRVTAHYAGGTHHTEADPAGGPDRVTKIVQIHEG